MSIQAGVVQKHYQTPGIQGGNSSVFENGAVMFNNLRNNA
jgi:hypothetical protein